MSGHALYVGHLRHRRTRPTAHAFTYPLFMPLLDIDDLDGAATVSPWVSRDRFNWATIDDRDQDGPSGLPLRARLAHWAASEGQSLPTGPILRLSHLRYLGYIFNPIALYFCYHADATTPTLGAVIAEVTSTFGERTRYWLPGPAPGARHVRHRTPKRMHVSPFNHGHLDYTFRVTPPGRSLIVHMTTIDRTDPDPTPFFDATLTMRREPWAPGALHRALRRHPVMTAGVMAAIHLEALRLWWKGLPYVPHPLTPRERRLRRREAAL